MKYNMLDSFTTRQKQIGSVLLTLAVYTWLINWQAAILLVIAVGFHELSHLWAARRMGLRTGGFYLMPFMGGVAFITQRYKTLGQQAFVVLLGPVGGGLLAVLTAVVFYFTKLPFLAAAATWMCYLNLFNLAPFSFMDGGQLMDTISYSINRTLGLVLRAASTVVAIIFLLKVAPMIAVLVIVFGLPSLFMEYKNWKAYREGDFYLCSSEYLHPPKKLTLGQGAMTVGGWLITAIVLLITMGSLTSNPMESIQTIFHP